MNPHRKHSNGGSEDIRRRIEATAAIVDAVTVYAIDYPQELVTPVSLPANVHLHLYERGIDPRPWRWRYPLPCIRRYNRRMILDIRREVADHAKQLVVFVEGMQLFGLWSDIKDIVPKNATIILRAHNVEGDYHRSVAMESRGFLKLAHQVSSAQYQLLEDRLLGQFSYIYCISEKEIENLRKRYPEIAGRLRLVLPIPRLNKLGHLALEVNGPFILAYFGDLTLPNNYIGLHWFCKNVLPQMHAQKAQLHIAGNGSEQFAPYEGVEVYGFVDNIDEFACNAHVIVAPIFSGAGVKIKVLDAIGYGKPLVTTPKGAEGFPSWLTERINIAADAKEFQVILQRILRFYEDATKMAGEVQKEISTKMSADNFRRQLSGDIL